MDKNNVLSISFDADKLDKDIFDWSSLPDDRRIISDKICNETYGCNNRVLYNKLKSKILFNKNVNIKSYLLESYDYNSINRRDLIYRIGLAKTMNNSDPLIAIIYPYDIELISDSTYKDAYKEEFLNIYNRFIRLSDKYQKYSNMYSVQLFGYNVRSMYQLIYSDIISNNDNDSLVFKIYYGKNTINLDGDEFIELHEKQLAFFDELIKSLKGEIKEKLNVNCDILLEKDIY